MYKNMVVITEKRQQYLWQSKRLESFKKWPFKDSSKCSKLKMAEAGFFWVGSKSEPDSVQCFVCNKQLDGWESTDDPWHEHTKHSSKCLFVMLGKSEEMLTVFDLYDLLHAMLNNLFEKFCAEKKKKVAALNDDYLSLYNQILKS